MELEQQLAQVLMQQQDRDTVIQRLRQDTVDYQAYYRQRIEQLEAQLQEQYLLNQQLSGSQVHHEQRVWQLENYHKLADQELVQLRQQAESAQQQLQEAQAAVQQIQTHLEEKEAQLQEQQAQIAKIQATKAKLINELAESRRQALEANQHLQSHQQTIAEQSEQITTLTDQLTQEQLKSAALFEELQAIHQPQGIAEEKGGEDKGAKKRFKWSLGG
jgi:chromosome segregation ATPase